MDDFSNASLLLQKDPTPQDFKSTFSPDLIPKCKLFAKIVAFCCIFIPIALLIAWNMDPVGMANASHFLNIRQIPSLKIIFAGLSLWFMQYPKGTWQDSLAKFLAIAIIALTIGSFIKHVFGFDIWGMVFPEWLAGTQQFAPKNLFMQILSDINFILMGICLFCFRTERLPLLKFFQVMILLLAAISLIIVYSLSFDVSIAIHAMDDYKPWVINCLLVGLFNLGLFYSRPTEGLAGLFTNNTLGGYIARRFLIFPSTIPLFIWAIIHILQVTPFWIPSLIYGLTVFVNMFVISVVMIIYSYYLWKSDLQRRLALEDQIQITSKLEISNRDLKDFAYVVSHDLKAPLRGISSLATWMQEDSGEKLGEEGRRQMNMMIDKAAEMNTLISGILAYSQAGMKVEEIVQVNPGGLFKNVLDLIPNEKNAKVEIEAMPPLINCPQVQFREVLQNLISNALKYIDKKEGLITIRCRDAGNFWEFSVEDNGIGIEENNFEKIFQAFETLGPKKSSDSSGIGLSIVRRLVTSWGGKVWVKSILGQGSTFYFTIPKNFKS